MNCKLCAWFYSDIDENGYPISKQYCHYNRDDGYAPCELEDNEKETYEE